jgi:hypothetical protein
LVIRVYKKCIEINNDMSNILKPSRDFANKDLVHFHFSGRGSPTHKGTLSCHLKKPECKVPLDPECRRLSPYPRYASRSYQVISGELFEHITYIKSIALILTRGFMGGMTIKRGA